MQGGEEVELLNLTPTGRILFRLPRGSLPVEFFQLEGDSATVDAVADTLVFEPDKSRFMILWRASIPLRRNMFEVPMGVVGRMPSGWYRARKLGKDYYSNLGELVQAQRS